MTNRLIYALAACLCLGTAASAADLPGKAPRVADPYGNSGWYWLLESHLNGTKVGVTAPSGTLASIFAAGGNVGLGGGYVWALAPNRQVAIEGWVDYANTGATAMGASLITKLSGTQRILYIGDSSMFTQWLPNLSLTSLFPGPVLPTSATVCPNPPSCNPLSRPYLGLVVREAQNELAMGLLSDKAIRVTWGVTTGFKTRMTDGSDVDAYAAVTSSSGPHLLGGITPGSAIVARDGVTFSAGITWNHALTNKLLGL